MGINQAWFLPRAFRRIKHQESELISCEKSWEVKCPQQQLSCDPVTWQIIHLSLTLSNIPGLQQPESAYNSLNQPTTAWNVFTCTMSLRKQPGNDHSSELNTFKLFNVQLNSFIHTRTHTQLLLSRLPESLGTNTSHPHIFRHDLTAWL